VDLSLPQSPDGFAAATWSDVAPFYEALASHSLDRESVESWLAAWSRLEELLTEAAATAMIAYTLDTEDRVRESARRMFPSLPSWRSWAPAIRRSPAP
jgi:hypothetical protein